MDAELKKEQRRQNTIQGIVLTDPVMNLKSAILCLNPDLQLDAHLLATESQISAVNITTCFLWPDLCLLCDCDSILEVKFFSQATWNEQI